MISIRGNAARLICTTALHMRSSNPTSIQAYSLQAEKTVGNRVRRQPMKVVDIVDGLGAGRRGRDSTIAIEANTEAKDGVDTCSVQSAGSEETNF